MGSLSRRWLIHYLDHNSSRGIISIDGTLIVKAWRMKSLIVLHCCSVEVFHDKRLLYFVVFVGNTSRLMHFPNHTVDKLISIEGNLNVSTSRVRERLCCIVAVYVVNILYVTTMCRCLSMHILIHFPNCNLRN